MIELYLIRHCEGNANNNELVCGDEEDDLSEFGIMQLESLKRFVELNRLLVDVVYSSDWKRAVRTAKGVFRDGIEVSSSLGETDSGLDANLKYSQFVNSYPDFYSSRHNKYSCGESHIEMKQRVVSFVDNIIKNSANKRIVIVSHAGPISVILQHLLNLDFVEYFPRFAPAHGSITKLQIDDNGNFDQMILFSYTPEPSTVFKLLNEIKNWP